jgi:aminoacyl tRNA synthase complex-interacting multifunctional protein 1
MDLLDATIADLEAKLNLQPGETRDSLSSSVIVADTGSNGNASDALVIDAPKNEEKSKKKEKKAKQPAPAAAAEGGDADVPDICKIEFRVGKITKVWYHEKADKLYCEEIDCGEADGPRQIASGLRPHFTLEQMEQQQRLLVVANLKAKNLVGFKSHGMVLCAAKVQEDGSELVEFVEPPLDAPLGEIVQYQGLPPTQPAAASQVEKKKIFANIVEGLRTTDDEGLAAWNGHLFMTSAGPCKAKSIKGGVMR